MTCMYDRDEQCFEDCPDCPRACDAEAAREAFGDSYRYRQKYRDYVAKRRFEEKEHNENEKNELEKYLGKIVKITLYDGSTYTGELHKTGEERFKKHPDLYLPRNYYFLINTDLPLTICCKSCMFKSSHVTKIEEREENEI